MIGITDDELLNSRYNDIEVMKKIKKYSKLVLYRNQIDKMGDTLQMITDTINVEKDRKTIG